MSENEAAGSRGKFHVPNVEEIKHTLAEGAHHVGSVAHRVGDAVKEKGDKFVHSVSDQVHHVRDKIRETNDRMGKALAKKRWVRDVASRLSPNSVLVVAIAVFLAGLPENREAAARKAQSMKKKLRQSRSTATEASKHSYNESAARDEEVLSDDGCTTPATLRTTRRTSGADQLRVVYTRSSRVTLCVPSRGASISTSWRS